MAAGYCKLYDGSVSFLETFVSHATMNYGPSHPNIIQLHAAVSVNNMHATVFHDGTTMDFKNVSPLTC
jgi:hypothetical protein